MSPAPHLRTLIVAVSFTDFPFVNAAVIAKVSTPWNPACGL